MAQSGSQAAEPTIWLHEMCTSVHFHYRTLASGGWYSECGCCHLADHADELVIAGNEVRL